MSVSGATLTLDHPRLALRDDWRTYELLAPWTYRWLHDGRTHEITLPAGFRTDLASVPRTFWRFVAPGDLRQASLPHDLIYSYAGHVPADYYTVDSLPAPESWTRQSADRLFARVMRDAGVSMPRRRAAYLAVRVAGWAVWQRYERTLLMANSL